MGWVLSIVQQLPYATVLLGLCLIAAYWNRKRAAIFAGALLCAMTVTIVNPPYTPVPFFAIYACIAAVAFFLLDWKAGALLALVSLPGAALAFGFINQYQRDVGGEVLFVLALLAGAILKPSGGISTSIGGFAFRGGHSSNAGRHHGSAGASTVVSPAVKIDK